MIKRYRNSFYMTEDQFSWFNPGETSVHAFITCSVLMNQSYWTLWLACVNHPAYEYNVQEHVTDVHAYVVNCKTSEVNFEMAFVLLVLNELKGCPTIFKKFPTNKSPNNIVLSDILPSISNHYTSTTNLQEKKRKKNVKL